MNIEPYQRFSVLARKYQLPINANEKTWQAIEKKDSRIPMDQKFIFNPYENESIGIILMLNRLRVT